MTSPAEAPPSGVPHAERRAFAMAIAAIAMWSTIATGFKLALGALTPMQLTFVGTLVSLVFFALLELIRAARGSSEKTLMGTKGVWRAAALGLINPFLYYFVLLEAYDRLPAQVAQPLNYTWAVTMAVLAVPILGQRLRPRTWLGIVVSYVGVAVLLTRGEFAAPDHFDFIGVLLALASTVIWALYWLLTTRLLPSAEPSRTMLIGFATATPPIALACALTDGLPPIATETFVFGAWIGLLEMGAAFALWQRSLQLTNRAGVIAQLIFLSPCVSLVLIYVFVGEVIHPSAIVALGLILAGLALARRSD